MKRIKTIATAVCVALAAIVNAQEPFKNASLSFDTRADDLLKRLTLEEKVSLMVDASKPIERLGINEYNWWNEALHGVARAGLATVFPQPIGMAASFDNGAIHHVFNAISDEARAKHHHFLAADTRERYQGLTMWTPTINIFRDPRWGRGIETYGEDPYLTSVMGVSAVKGLQGPANQKYDKLHACAKHFAVHSGPEWNRHSFNAKNIKPRDLHETYLPAFEALVKDAKVKEVMCAYNRFEGEPCCGSNQLLTNILRKKWGFEGIVLSDCGAIADFFKENAHATHADAASASAAAVLSGTDLDCGSSYKALVTGVKMGYIKESDINISVKRLLKARFELGELDNQRDVSWSNIPYTVVGSAEHDSLSLDMARKSMTLLLNKDGILPLKSGNLKIAVMGPNAKDSVMQWGNYNGTPAKTITILDGIRAAVGNTNKVIYEQGSGLVDNIIIESVFSQCYSENGQGFSAEYWNNLDRKGPAAVKQQIKIPFNFSTTGATVFAPGVQLTDFSATYKSVFSPKVSGDLALELFVNGNARLLIDDVEVKTAKTNHGSRKMNYILKAVAGKSYRIQIDFAYNRGDAQLNFDLGYKQQINIEQSIAKVKDADVVIFVGGISPSLEGEEMGVEIPGFKRGDRTDIELPAVQRNLLKALKNAGKKVVMVNCSGSPIGLTAEIESCEAILQAWYPGQSGGKAVADVLFGNFNPSGRLPITFYKDISQLPDFENYDMAGRTYRYMQKKPLFPFGYGLSYTTFKYGRPGLKRNKLKVGQSANLLVPVSNIGDRSGEEVIQVYLKKQGDVSGPIKTLRAFQRVKFEKGQLRNVEFLIIPKQFEWWNEESQAMEMQPGNYELLVGASSDDKALQSIGISIR